MQNAEKKSPGLFHFCKPDDLLGSSYFDRDFVNVRNYTFTISMYFVISPIIYYYLLIFERKSPISSL